MDTRGSINGRSQVSPWILVGPSMDTCGSIHGNVWVNQSTLVGQSMYTRRSIHSFIQYMGICLVDPPRGHLWSNPWTLLGL